MKRRKPWIPYGDVFKKIYKDPKMAVGYLNTSLEEGNFDAFLLALRNVADVHRGGLAKIAREANLNREHLYRMLSKRGNPGMRNIIAVINALGFRLSLVDQTRLDKAA